MRRLHGGWSGWLPLVWAGGVLLTAGCGEAPAPAPVGPPGPMGAMDAPPGNGGPAFSPAPRTPAPSVTGVPVQGGATAGEMAPPGADKLVATPTAIPAPPLLVDGFEAADGWFVTDFSNPAQVHKFKAPYTAQRDQLALQLAYQAGDKGKTCIKLDRRLSLKPDGKMTLTVFNHAQADIAVAAAFSTGEKHEWFESLPQTAAPGWNTLSWNFADVAWKSEASKWVNNVPIGQTADARAIHLLVFNEHRTGAMTIGGLIIEAVRPTPPAPAPTQEVDWDSVVAQLPVNPLGRQKGLQAGSWISDMTGDPARVLVAPNALSTTTDRMLVLDWAAATAPEQRKTGFVAAKQSFAPPLPLDKTGTIAFDVYNPGDGEAAISVGIVTGETAVYHESKPCKLAPKAWSTIKLSLAAQDYKSAATQWEPTGGIASADKLAALVIKAYTTQTAGRLMVTALTAPVVQLPPSPQPMPPVERQPAPAPQPAPTPEAAPAPAPVPAPAPEAPVPAPAPAPAPEAAPAPAPVPPPAQDMAPPPAPPMDPNAAP